MPKSRVVYDNQLKETPEWQQLYSKWHNIRKGLYSEAFEEFTAFYEWSLASGYEFGMKLRKLVESLPYSPENCVWVAPSDKPLYPTDEEKTAIAKWNETVNRIRVHFGMEPFETESMCSATEKVEE